MDEKDELILAALKADGSLTTRQISKKTSIPITTVHKRILKLKESGIIKRFTVVVDNKKIGLDFAAIILVSCDYKALRELKKDQHQLAEEIRNMPEVESVDIVTGVIDMLVKVRMRNVEQFDSFLLRKMQKLPGVDRTQSLVVIAEVE